MDRLYYSNLCPHCKDVLEFIKTNNLMNKLEFFCVDKRVQDKTTGIIYIIAEDNKRKDALPPNIQDVPTLLLVREQYRIILGKEIMNYFAPKIKNVFNEINTHQPSPLTNNTQFFSIYGDEDELKNKIGYIETPPENFINNKINQNITIELIEKQRNAELENTRD